MGGDMMRGFGTMLFLMGLVCAVVGGGVVALIWWLT